MNQEHTVIPLTTAQLWRFSSSYYELHGVKKACLDLQDQFGGNVNIVLLLKYLDLHQVNIDNDSLTILINSTNKTEALLTHYRQLRKSLKPHLPQRLYQDALTFELELEKQQQSDLVSALSTLVRVEVHEKTLVSSYCEQLNAAHLTSRFISLPID